MVKFDLAKESNWGTNMPVYPYKCKTCGFKFDFYHYSHKEKPPHCKECGGEVERNWGDGSGSLGIRIH